MIRFADPAGYAELGVATNFSFLRGASHPEELVAQAIALGLDGIGITDRNSLAGIVRAHLFLRHNKEAAGALRVVPGTRLVFADGTPDILAYPQDRTAYGRLCRLLTQGNIRAEKGGCRLGLDDLLAWQEGLQLIALPASSFDPEIDGRLAARSFADFEEETDEPRGLLLPLAGEGGPTKSGRMRAPGVMRDDNRTSSGTPLIRPRFAGPPSPASGRRDGNALSRLAAACPGRLWIGAAMTYGRSPRGDLAARRRLADKLGVPLIATNDVVMHDPARRPLLDVVTCIRHGINLDAAGRKLALNAERHLKPAAEMRRLFSEAPEAVTETLRFLDTLAFSLDELGNDYPEELREGWDTPQDALAAFAAQGAARRYPGGIPNHVTTAIAHELDLVRQMAYAPYFLTVHDIVRFARSRGILCQGRGSAANSTLCFCLGITEVDPAFHDLLFERFISLDRKEPPDIDVDFEHERREEVMQYIYEHYGRARAALTATVVTYRARSAVREVGKAFGLSEDAIGALSGTIWGWGEGASVDETATRSTGLDPAEPGLRQVLDLARQLEGFPRHLSQHTGGFVITRSRLDEVVPIANASMDGSHDDRMGQGRSRRARHPQDRRAGARHAVLPARLFRFAGEPLRPARDARLDPAGGESRLRDDPEGRHDRRLPDREPRADVDAAAPQARDLLRPRHRGGDRAPRPDPGRHGAPLPAPPHQEGDRDLSLARARARARQDARRAAVPGAGDADRHRRRGLHPVRGRPAAPRDGDLQARRHDLDLLRQDGARAWSSAATRRTSPPAASSRSKGSAPTAFPKATRPRSRCSSTPRAG